MDPMSNRMVWGIPVEPGFEVFSAMVVDDGVVYGQWSSCEADGPAGLAAFDAATGARRWRTPPLWTAKLTQFVPSTPLNGVYIVATGSVAPMLTDLVAMDTASGAELWRTHLDPPAFFGPSAASDGSLVIIAAVTATSDSSLQALERTTGQTRWTIGLPAGSYPGESLISDGVLIVQVDSGATRMVNAYELATGQPMWSTPGVLPSRAGAASAGVVVVLSDPFAARATIGVDVATGDERWRRDGWGEMYLGGATPARIPLMPYPDEQAPPSTAGLPATITDQPPVENLMTVEIVDISTGVAVTRLPPTLRPQYAGPGGYLAMDDNGYTVLDPNGTPVGNIPRLPPQNAEETVPPIIATDHQVYLARGCPNSG